MPGLDNPDMITDIYLEVGVHGEVIEVYFDSECGVVFRTVGVVETGDGGDVEINHVLLDLLSQVVTVPRPVPGQTKLGLGTLTKYQRYQQLVRINQSPALRGISCL